MKVLVYDIAAEDGGGLFVLKNFYQQVLGKSIDNIEWIFMTSLAVLEETENIKVLSYKWIKKSWLHRLFFEKIHLPKILRGIEPDVILSLQNMPVQYNKARQMVYLHQSLQYCPKRFSFFKKEELSLAIRQKIICNIYKRNLKKADHIFVQTQWIKDATKKWIRFPESEITVVPVTLEQIPKFATEYDGHESNIFFYPARGVIYKNHEVIIQACRTLQEQGIEGYKMIFTLESDESTYVSRLREMAKGLPIEFVGLMQYDEVWKQYQKSVLVFPSYLETCGLPLLEARSVGSTILASDMPFAHEVLKGYENAQYFGYDNPDELAELMKNVLKKKIEYVCHKEEFVQEENSLLENVLKLILDV